VLTAETATFKPTLSVAKQRIGAPEGIEAARAPVVGRGQPP